MPGWKPTILEQMVMAMLLGVLLSRFVKETKIWKNASMNNLLN